MDVIFVPLAYAYVRTLQGFCVFCCHKCHTFWITPCYCAGYICFVMFFDAFAENIGLFYWKRRLVLLKMTACFTENDVLFYWKRRVVFWRERKSCETYGKMEKQNGVKRQIVLGVCDTCDSKKWEIPVMRDRAYTRMCARASLLFQFDVHRLDFLEGNPLVFSIYQHLYKRRSQCSSCLVEREMTSENASGGSEKLVDNLLSR